jgi:hypothetical protein
MAKIDSVACYYYCRQSGFRIVIKFVQIYRQQKQNHGLTELNNLFDLDLTIDKSQTIKQYRLADHMIAQIMQFKGIGILNLALKNILYMFCVR